MDRNYVAFISYRHAEMDSAIAKTIHSQIEQYRIPKGLRKDGSSRLGLVFRDEEELHAASDLTAEIQNALENTEYLIVICSKNSIESPWVGREIDYFLKNHDRSKILAVLASGEPSEVFPSQLTLTPEGELIEPLAVDVRAETISGNKKKVRKELPRLISAMLDCPYDALVMREQKRKTRRITAIAAGIMAILLGFTSMVLVKNRQIELVNNQLEIKNTQLDQANTDLSQANTDLAEQKAAVQLRESKLLAQDAEADLKNADYNGAIEKALDALPESEADNRPYHAPAERVLMSAANVFLSGSPEEELNTICLEQLTDVADFAITQDGTRVVSVDSFGAVCCFDADTGRQLWCQYAASDNGSSATSNLHVFLCCDDSIVIRSTRTHLTAYNLQTGEQVWIQTVGQIPDGYMFYRADREVMVLVTAYEPVQFQTTYQLTEISVATGEILQAIPFCAPDGSPLYDFQNTPGNALSTSGRFSSDGNIFYSAFFSKDAQLYCFRTDLTAGTAEQILVHEQTYQNDSVVTGLFFGGETITLIIQHPSDSILISALQFGMDTGKLLWQTDIPEDKYHILFEVVPGNVLASQTDILITAYNHLYRLNRETGALVETVQFESDLVSMISNNGYQFSFIQSNGTNLLGWLNTSSELMLTNNPFLQVWAELGDCTIADIWGGGVLQLDTSNDSLHLGIGNFVSPGYVALIPKDQENVIQIIRPKQGPTLVDYAAIALPEDDFSASSDCSVRSVGSQLAVGPFFKSNSNYSDYRHHYFILDPAAQQITASFSPQDYYDNDELFWIPDTLEPLICEDGEGIYLLNADGSQEMICSFEALQEALAEEDGWWSSLSLFGCDSANLPDGKTLLTAACNPKSLQFWNNGIPIGQVSLPDHLQFPARENPNTAQLLKVGTNDWIATGFYVFGNSIPLENLAFYNIARDSWTALNDDAIFYNRNALTLAQEKDLLAYVDQDGMLQIWDLNTGNAATQFSTQIPFGSVLKMQFLLDDTHLAIKTSGGYLRIYDLASGEQVYHDKFNDSYSDRLEIYEDSAHDRLYLRGGDNSSICLDLRSWTALGYPDAMLYYHSATTSIYVKGNSWEGDPLLYGQIPSTAELVRLAADYLAES